MSLFTLVCHDHEPFRRDAGHGGKGDMDLLFERLVQSCSPTMTDRHYLNSLWIPLKMIEDKRFLAAAVVHALMP
jgi:hypothetical protein